MKLRQWKSNSVCASPFLSGDRVSWLDVVSMQVFSLLRQRRTSFCKRQREREKEKERDPHMIPWSILFLQTLEETRGQETSQEYFVRICFDGMWSPSISKVAVHARDCIIFQFYVNTLFLSLSLFSGCLSLLHESKIFAIQILLQSIKWPASCI